MSEQSGSSWGNSYQFLQLVGEHFSDRKPYQHFIGMHSAPQSLTYILYNWLHFITHTLWSLSWRKKFKCGSPLQPAPSTSGSHLSRAGLTWCFKPCSFLQERLKVRKTFVFAAAFNWTQLGILPNIWNKLQETRRSAATLTTFKSRLKTFLFAAAFNWTIHILNCTVTFFHVFFFF